MRSSEEIVEILSGIEWLLQSVRWNKYNKEKGYLLMGAIITIHNISTVYIVQYMLSRSNTHVKLRHRTQCHEEQKQDL